MNVDINRFLDKWGVKKYVNSTVKEITPEGVVIVDEKNNEQLLPCDQIVLALGRDPFKPLEEGLKAANMPIR